MSNFMERKRGKEREVREREDKGRGEDRGEAQPAVSYSSPSRHVSEAELPAGHSHMSDPS